MKKNISKLVQAGLAASMLGALLSPTLAGNFSDLADTHTFYPYIEALATDDVVGGYSDGTFRPDTTVSRGAMSKFVMNGLGFDVNTSCEEFPDVASDNTFYEYITTLKCEGVIDGYSDGTFRPDNNVNRGAAMKFIIQGYLISGQVPMASNKANQEFSDLPQDHTFFDFVMFGKDLGIVGGYSDGTYKPSNPVTRGAMSKMVANTRVEMGLAEEIVIPETPEEPETFVLDLSDTQVAELLDDDYIIGDPTSAKAMIVMWADFDDPFNNQFITSLTTSALDEIKANYIDTGKAILVVRDFPLTMLNPNAMFKAHTYACIAKAMTEGQTSSQEMINVMNWLVMSDYSNTSQLDYLLNTIVGSSDPDSIKSCINNETYKSEIEDDMTYANSIGIYGTPTFSLIGQNSSNELEVLTIEGTHPYSSFVTELSKFGL